LQIARVERRASIPDLYNMVNDSRWSELAGLLAELA